MTNLPAPTAAYLRAVCKFLACESSGIAEFVRVQARAHHADSRTAKLYDQSDYDVTLECVELVQV